MISSPDYWRSSKQWREWLGLRGVVVASTYIRVSNLSQPAPYSYVVVETKDKTRFEAMGVDHQELVVGDKVECVFRKMLVPDTSGVIPYGMKVQKI